MKFLMVMWHFHLHSVLDDEKEEIYVADRAIFCDRLHAHYNQTRKAKHFAVWSLILSALKTGADKQAFFQYKVASGWLGEGRFFP